MILSHIYDVDISKPLLPTILQPMMVTGDKLANRIGIRLKNGAQPYAPDGSCRGYVLRADGATVPILNGVVNGNEMYIDLPEAAYAKQGAVVISILCVTSSAVTTVFLGSGTVNRSQTDVVIDPGTVIDDISTLIQAIETAVASIPLDYSALSAAVTALQALPTDTVLYGSDQTLTDAQKAQARENIGAAGESDVADLQSAVSGMNTATASDEGKALKAKTVSDGKVTEWEFGEAGTQVTVDPTLTQSGEAADAKAAGDAIKFVQAATMTEVATAISGTKASGKYAYINNNNKVSTEDVTGCNSFAYDVSSWAGKPVRFSTTILSASYPIAFIVRNSSGDVVQSISSATTLVYTNYYVDLVAGAKYVNINVASTATVSLHGIEYDSRIDAVAADVQSVEAELADVEAELADVKALEYFPSFGSLSLNNTAPGKCVSKSANNTVTVNTVTGANCKIFNVGTIAGGIIQFTATMVNSTYPTAVLVVNSSSKVVQEISNLNVLAYTNYRFVLSDEANLLYINYTDSLTANQVIPKYLSDLSFILDNELHYSDVNHRIRGKSCVCFGDSITWYDGNAYNWGKEQGITAKGYESYLREAGMTVSNQGYSGATMPQIVNSKIMEFDFTGYDYVTITSGANDSRYNVTVGEIQTSDFDSSFIGRLQAGIEYILTSNPEIKILLITPIRGWIYTPDGYAYLPKPETDGVVEKKYADAIKAVAEYYGLPVCDWYSDCGVNIFTRDWYINDPEPDPTAAENPNPLYSLHPSNKGFKRMAQLLLPVIRSI